MQPQRLRKMTTSCSCALFKKKEKIKIVTPGFLFPWLRFSIWQEVSILRPFIKTAWLSPFLLLSFLSCFFFFFLNYWLLNTWPISHKRGKPVHETQRPLAVSVCCLFVLSTLCLLHLKSPLLFRACLRVCSSPFGGLRRRCSRLNVAGP